MKEELRRLPMIGLLVIVAAIFALSGCSDRSPLEPSVAQSADPGLSTSKILSLESSLVVSSEKLITSLLGGEIDIVRDSYEHEFYVPAGALESDVTITVTTSKERVGRRNAIVFDFGPEGLVFSKAAVLSFQMAELSSTATSGKLFYFDPAVNSWVYQGSAGVKDGMALFSIYHFSKYAISD